MSELIVQICEIDSVEPCPNSDRLDVYTIKGWKIVSSRIDADGNQIPRYIVGDRVIYIPPDSVLPLELSDKLDITKYLSPVKNELGEYAGGRVRAIRLRGQPSYGCMFEAEDGLEIGTDVAEKYGITKWEPPPEHIDGDAEKSNPRFERYTSIENIGNFPHMIEENEEVIFTEKCHGCNFRGGRIFEDGSFIYAAGSHGVRRKEFEESGKRSKFWGPMTDNVKRLLDFLCNDEKNVMIYGEIIGAGIQDMTYGYTNGISFRMFDISVDGIYLDFDYKVELFNKFEIDMVPILYRGPFSKEKVAEYTSGETTICPPEKAGKFKGREGIVITPVKERIDYMGRRVILKSISVDYLARKGGTDSH